MNDSVLVGNYYLSLWEVLFALSIVVGGKVVGGYIMKAIYDLVREDDAAEPPTPRAARPGGRQTIRARTLLWGGLAALFVVSGLLQIRPFLVTASPGLVAAAVGPASAGSWLHAVVMTGVRSWFSDPTASNIISVLAQWSLASLLWLGRDRLVGRIGLYLMLALSLLEWVFGEGFGHLATVAGYWIGAPGAALLYALGAVLLLTPEEAWRSGKVRRVGLRATAVYWAFGAALQLARMGQWTGLSSAIARFDGNYARLGLVVVTRGAAGFGSAPQGVLLSAAAAAVMVLLAVLMWRTRWQSVGGLLSLLAVFYLWAVVEGFGSAVHFAENGGGFPVFAVLFASVWYAPREGARQEAVMASEQGA